MSCWFCVLELGGWVSFSTLRLVILCSRGKRRCEGLTKGGDAVEPTSDVIHSIGMLK